MKALSFSVLKTLRELDPEFFEGTSQSLPPREREQRLLDHELRWRRWSLGLPIEADCTSDEMSSLEHDASAETPAVSASEEDDEQEDDENGRECCCCCCC